MSKMQLLLLGHFECLLPSGKPVMLAMRKAEVLLAYLALAPGIRHPRERLINLLWSNRGEEQARNSLRQCLSAIRKTLGDAADLTLQVDRSTVSLKADVIEVDALEFERLAGIEEPTSLADAGGLYRGEFLEGIAIRDAACQEWLDSERARFKRQYIEILSSFAHSQLATRDFNAAMRSAESLVEQDSLSESAWRLLMRALHENGDRNHALQAFKRCQQTLRDELEVDPEAETIALRDAIASGQAKTDAPAQATAAATDPITPATAKTDDHSIAVLPFDNLSGDPEQEYFSDGITDSIIMNLALFPRLQVKSRNSSFAFKQQIKSVGEICDELKVDYIVEGSIRRSQDRIRVTVQLIESTAGNQIWGKRYDADLCDLFELEEELSRTIAVTVTGQIESDLQRIACARGATDQRAYDLLLAGIYHLNRSDRENISIAIDKLNDCLVQDPTNIRAHAATYQCHILNWMDRLVENYQQSFEMAGEYARKTLALDPALGEAQYTYGEYLMFCHKHEQAGKHLEKALATNPNNPDFLTAKAMHLSMQGNFKAALELAASTYELDPYNWWVDWNLAEAQFLCGLYQNTIDTIENSKNAPGFIRIYAVAANVKLGNLDVARQSLLEYLQSCRESMLSMPQTLNDWLQYTVDTAPFADAQINQDIIDCLVQAGLGDELNSPPDTQDVTDQPTILVLPFSNLSDDPEQEYFSDGITAGIILALGQFDGIVVKSQKTSFAFKASSLSSVDIAAKVGADFLVEGSIRKSAQRIRLSVQLIEADKGSQVWGKQYDEELQDILELEQELSQALAATISGRLGHRIQQSAARKPARDMKSYDHLMRGLYHFGKFTARDLRIAREEIEKCIAGDPENVQAHANLAEAYTVELLENWAKDRSLARQKALGHFETALELDPDNALAHAYFADFLNIDGNYDEAEFHADRAIEINHTCSEGHAARADLFSGERRHDEAIREADICLQLDPYSVGSIWVTGSVYCNAGRYREAIKFLRRIPHPPPTINIIIANCFMGMGLIDEGRAEIARYLQLAKQQMSHLPDSVNAWREHLRQTSSNYRHDEDFEQLFKHLLEAGLCDELGGEEQEVPSIAVLPFENMSGDPEQAFFSDGITTDLIATLSKFRHLRIVARHSTEIYRERKASIAEIAAEQGVRYILEGSVRKSGKRIRVSAELIDSQSGQNCWSERYDRDLDDLFAVQDELTQQIALAMKVQLDDGDMARHRSAGTHNIKAWELTMTAVDLQDTYIQQNIFEARSLAKQALALDPEYVFAHVVLAWTYWQDVYGGWSEDPEQSLIDSETSSQLALQLDPDNADALAQAGTGFVMRHNTDKAMEYSRRAVEIEPGNAENQALRAFACIFAGDYEQARVHHQHMQRLCPVLPNWYYLILGQIEQYDGDLDQAICVYKQGIAVEPDSTLCRFYLVHALMQKGDISAAQKLADEIQALDSSANGGGLVRAVSMDAALRDQFHQHLAQFELVQD